MTPEKHEVLNMRGLSNVTMVEVAEGKGTTESYSRIVRYFYDKDGSSLGKIDPVD